MVITNKMDNPTPGGTDPNVVMPLAPSVAKRYFGKEARNMYTYGVDGSGSCFFHSILVALNPYDFRDLPLAKQKKLANAFRCRLGSKNSGSLGSLTASRRKKILADLCKPKTWAESNMISHTRDITGLNLVFLDDSRNFRIFCDMPGDQSNPTVIVRWVSNSHFEPIIRRTPDGTTTAVFDPVKDAKLLGGLFEQFSRQCGVKK